MELPYLAYPTDNYLPLHLQNGFVSGAVSGEGRGRRVDYHIMKRQLRSHDTSPLGTRDGFFKALFPHKFEGINVHSCSRTWKNKAVMSPHSYFLFDKRK